MTQSHSTKRPPSKARAKAPSAAERAPADTADAPDNPYASAYSAPRLRHKLARYAKVAGRDVVEKALLLYYAAQRDGVPVWARATIAGALGYFIVPMDAVPDLLPGVGYVDDLGVLALAVATVASYIDDTVRERTAVKLRDWFGDPPRDGDNA